MDSSSISSGKIVFELNENTKLFSNVAKAIRICIWAKRSPILFQIEKENVQKSIKNLRTVQCDCDIQGHHTNQLRGPSPNGNHFIGLRLIFSSLENRSGSNFSGLG